MLAFSLGIPLHATDSSYIKVHFIYGSKPAKAYKDSEHKWFGGLHGVHVGIEIAENRVLHFGPTTNEIHVFNRSGEDAHGRYFLSDTTAFWSIFNDSISKLKRLSIVIPIDSTQKSQLDSLAKQHLLECPYDYSFFGMRCASTAYDALAKIDLVEEWRRPKTIRKNFYPKRLRLRLLDMACKKNWKLVCFPGTNRRIWEQD